MMQIQERDIEEDGMRSWGSDAEDDNGFDKDYYFRTALVL